MARSRSPRSASRAIAIAGGNLRRAAVSVGITSVRLLAASLFFALGVATGCAPVEAPRPPAPIAARPAPIPAPVVESVEREDARARAEALVETLGLRELGNDDAVLQRAAAFGLDEALARRLVIALTRACLGAKDDKLKATACASFDVLASHRDDTVDALTAYLGETADPRGATPTARLLVRLHAAGSVAAARALDELLDRRMTTSYGACAPPTEAEIARSAASLSDFVVVETSGSGSMLTPRAPSPAELADLAYFYAATTGAGEPVGTFEEDRASPPLADGAAPLAARELLGASLREALANGALEDHAKLARRYLESLGFPGRLRVREERDQRWGGSGSSYVIRDLARTLELLGRAADAEPLYRRANPGGGACGTSVDSVRSGQIEGVIRTGEAARGCRAVVAERLFSVPLDLRKSYGTRRLTDAGFDVARLYRGALVTLGRRDVHALEAAFAADPRLGPAALARLRRLGPEDWATRTRAVAGHGAESKKAAIADLVAIARRAVTADRLDALEVLGELVEDHGYDPCVGFGGWGHGSSRLEREVPSLMHACDTRLAPAEADKVAADVAALARSPEADVRVAVAEALGRAGRPASRATLRALARDTFTTGGRMCRSVSGGPEKCGPDRPVRQAAEDALTRLDETEKQRADERRRAREASR